VIVAEWYKSNSTTDGKKLDFATVLEKWNDVVSPLNSPPLPDETDRRPRMRAQLYESIIEKARECQKELDAGTIPNERVRSGVSEPGRKWDWDSDLVCLSAM
jgi:hypothetical protein